MRDDRKMAARIFPDRSSTTINVTVEQLAGQKRIHVGPTR